jgi:hypothetical protein
MKEKISFLTRFGAGFRPGLFVRVAAALGILAACVSCSPPEAVRAQPTFEYRVIDISRGVSCPKLEAVFNQLGAEGWEVIESNAYITLKRQKRAN